MKKYYHCVIKELNGEQEYSYDYLIEAKNFAEANKAAEAYAGKFYNDKPYVCDGGYVFFGTISVEVESIMETTKDNFIKDLLYRYTLTRGGE